MQDVQGQAVIRKRLNRVRLGKLGYSKSEEKGVFKLRIDFGPGYRVYFGEDQDSIVILLCDGDKSSQERDIQWAHDYWADYLK